MFKLGLTYDDVALVPQFNNVTSRLDPSLNTWLTKDITMSIPILAANMDSVISDELAEVLIQYGSIPMFHRFADSSDRIEQLRKFPYSFISTGIGEEENKKLYHVLDNSKPLGILIDIAHGHDYRVLRFIEDLKSTGRDLQIIAGNVCTPGGYRDLVNAGADAVKVGVGPGAACTTRMVTGFGVPQFTAVYDIAQEAKKYRVPIIADGGIRGSRDIVLALAAGASSVMIGKLFAQTDEAASVLVHGNHAGTKDKVYRGQASREFQEAYFGELKAGTVPEGKEGYVRNTGSAKQLLDELLGGIRSGMTYGGAKDIKELQRKAEFMRVTAHYGIESGTRL